MNGESYGSMELDEEAMEYDEEMAEYDADEVDEMLEAMMDSAEAEDFAERRRKRGRKAPRKPVPTAQGRPAYRAPATGAYVTQKQLKDALDRVAVDVRRNAGGIKTINSRLGALNGRVNGVVTVATKHSRGIAKLETQMKVDGALELVEALSLDPVNGQLSLSPFQILKGAAKSGFLGDSKGPYDQPRGDRWPWRPVHHTKNAEIDLAAILDSNAFDLEAKLEVDPTFLEDLDHEHDPEVTSFVLREDRPIDVNRFMEWLTPLLMERGEDIYRTKGLFYARGFRERVVFQSVRMLTTMRPDRLWRDDERKHTEYVVIGRRLDREAFGEGLRSCVAV